MSVPKLPLSIKDSMSDIDKTATLADIEGTTGATAPAAASIPAESATAPTEAPTGEEAPATTDKPEAAEPEWFQKRISQITRQRGNEARRADRAEARLANLERELQELRKAPPASSAELRPQDFPSYDAFVAASAKQEAKVAAREELEAGLEARLDQERARSAGNRMEAFIDKATEAADAAGIDLDAVMETLKAAPNLSPTVADFLFTETKHPAQLAEYLAENPSELDRISRLGPALAAKSLAKLDAQVAPKAKPTATKAPAPGPTVGGRAVHHGDWRKSDDMSEFASGFMKEQDERRKMG